MADRWYYTHQGQTHGPVSAPELRQLAARRRILPEDLLWAEDADRDQAIEALGDPPLPPYIAGKRDVEPEDAERYQTIYAAHEGAVAAPTAGLHFTPELFAALDAAGISRHLVTLHVGAGTFLPVKADDTKDHRMHAEWGEVSPQTADALNAVRAAGGRIIGNNHNQKIQWKSRRPKKLYLFDFQNKSTRATSQWQNSGMRTILSTSLIISFIRVSTECLAQYIIS